MRPNHAEQLEEVRLHSEEQERKKVKDRQKKKFDKLLQRDGRRTSVVSSTSDRWVVNLSSKELTLPQQSVLRKGLNFAPAPGRVPVPRIIADVETALSRVSDECVAERARVKVTDLL